MARLYLDSDVTVRLVGFLSPGGHDAVTSSDLGRQRASDDEQMLTAFRESRILVTHNRKDFLLLHHAWTDWPPALTSVWPRHPGILVLDQVPDADLIGALTEFFGSDQPAVSGELFWWRASTGWYRRAGRDWQRTRN